MSEFLICTAFALIPLFLGISLLGKYIDIKQTAIQAARYQAWEYTVWYANDNEPNTGFNAADQPIKSTAITNNEARRLFFNGPGTELDTLAITTTANTSGGWTGNPFWQDHTGAPLYSGVNGAEAGQDSSDVTPNLPIVEQVVGTILRIFDFVFGAIGSLLGLGGSSVGFTAINPDGYSTSTVSMEVAVNTEFMDFEALNFNLLNPTNDTLDFVSTASVLTDGWNAGGVEHTNNQTGGTVPTTILKELFNMVPGLDLVIDFVTLLAPELRLCKPTISWEGGWDEATQTGDKGSLWLGYIDIDAVHPDRLEGGGTHTCNDAGMCDFEPAIPRTEESRDCIK